ncbi:hypothetical protein ABZ260_19530 [Streptosporangium sp. NPDC006013]|uniref:hypothetical protein n=1 Tax=Streptosporangium sp. NPDC006013 TaxID=3155596 RepID=UPI0033AACB36
MVDDLPWLDRASALVLGMAARRLNGLPVGMVAACRSGEPSFFDLGSLAVVYVHPLSEEAATELLTGRYPVMTPRVRRRLLDAARGNPLALLELPVSLGDLASTVAGALPAALPLTHRLQSVFASRVRALPAPFVELLLLAALDGTGDLRLVRAIDTDRGGGALHAAERSGLVRADESGERLTFHHPLIQSAIVDLSTSEQRRRAHAELAARLADRPERHAWHLAEATEEPDEKVAALLKEVAITNLRRGDSVGAVAQLLRAAQLSPPGKGRSGRLAEAAYLGSLVTGDLCDAPRLLEQARLADPGPGDLLSVAGARALIDFGGFGPRAPAGRVPTPDTGEPQRDRPRLAGGGPGRPGWSGRVRRARPRSLIESDPRRHDVLTAFRTKQTNSANCGRGPDLMRRPVVKERHTAKKVFARLVDEHQAVKVSYQMVRAYAARRRNEIGVRRKQLRRLTITAVIARRGGWRARWGGSRPESRPVHRHTGRSILVSLVLSHGKANTPPIERSVSRKCRAVKCQALTSKPSSPTSPCCTATSMRRVSGPRPL